MTGITTQAGDTSSPLPLTPPAVPAQVLVLGVARMIEGLRCFADEFGLAQRRVLGDVWEEFQGRPADEVLRGWLRSGEDGSRRIQRLFEHLMSHQVALLHGMEGVAREAVERFHPRQVQQRTPRVLGLRPGLWRNYCRYYRELVDNDHSLHRKLVLPGFLSGYMRSREGLREDTGGAPRNPTPASRR